MLDSTMSERELRQAWRQADLEVARRLAVLCYGRATATGDAEHLSRSAVVATRQRRELATRLEACSRLEVVAAPADVGLSPRPLERMLDVAAQTRALRPSAEAPQLSLLRQRLSAA